MATFEDLSLAQRCRIALLRDVKAICTETCHHLGLEITQPAVEIVGELVYKKLAVYGTDLEAFAKHAKRSTINSEDVKLLVRRCPSLKSHLNALAPTVPNTREKKRKTVAQTESPSKLKQQEQVSSKKEQNQPLVSSKEEKRDIDMDSLEDDVIFIDNFD